MQNMMGGRWEETWETTGHLGQLGDTLRRSDPLGVPASRGDKLPALLVSPHPPGAGTCFQVCE